MSPADEQRLRHLQTAHAGWREPDCNVCFLLRIVAELSAPPSQTNSPSIGDSDAAT